MRYDEINLTGILTISGLTGGDNQVIQSVNGTASWATASSPLSNSTIKRLPNNTIIVESVPFSDVDSGSNLINAITESVNVANQILASSTNRVTILLMPGVYDCQGNLNVYTPYVDIVGISKNPNSTIIKNSLSGYTIRYDSPATDNGLKNLHIKSPDQGEGANIFINEFDMYSRWENLILSGDGWLYSGDTESYINNLFGEFRNITCYADGKLGNFFNARNYINGVFENINITGGNLAFNILNIAEGEATIIGTFSDIRIFDTTKVFSDIVGVDASFKNLEIRGSSNTIFSTYTSSKNPQYLKISLDGGFINNGLDIFRTLGLLQLHVKNFKFELLADSTQYGFEGSPVDVIFENVIIDTNSAKGGSVETLFFDFLDTDIGMPVISATFSDVRVNGTVNKIFRTENGKNISLMNLNISKFDSRGGVIYYFITNPTGAQYLTCILVADTLTFDTVGHICVCDLNGSIKNMKIYNLTGNSFESSNFYGTFKNIYIKSDPGLDIFTSTGNIEGNFENILIESDGVLGTVFQASYLKGKYKDIKINNADNFFSGYVVIGEFNDIQFGEITQKCFYSNNNMEGNYKNIKGILSLDFFSSDNIQGNYENIYIKNAVNFFCASYANSPKIKSLRVKSCLRAFVFTNTMDMDIDDVIIESISNTYDTFSGTFIYGTYSNIQFLSKVKRSFISAYLLSGNFRNIYFPYLSGEFCFIGPNNFTGILDNVVCGGVFGGTFGGLMHNCEFRDIAFNPSGTIINKAIKINSSAVIENSDFVLKDTTYGYDTSVIAWGGSSLNNMHILNCGLSYPLPPASVGGSPTNRGITALSPNYNYTNLIDKIRINSLDQ